MSTQNHLAPILIARNLLYLRKEVRLKISPLRCIMTFLTSLNRREIWGSGAFQGQVVSRDHELWEGDIIELRI